MSPRRPRVDEHDQAVFRALADPTRRELLDALRRGPKTTGELAAEHPEMTRYGVMDHLNVLADAGLVIFTREGRHRVNHINPVPIAQIQQRWLSPFAQAPATELLTLKRSIEKRSVPVPQESVTPIAVEIEAEIVIDADATQVWTALTDGVGQWWDHSFTDKPYAIVLEPFIGGRFYEQFDESGAGALYATVTYIEPQRVLRTSGSMGMPGARQYVKTYRLEPDGDRTIVRTNASMLGDIGTERITGYRDGGQKLLESLKRYVERDPGVA
jgi:DNA-binding transcriptional ArsR family regulator/uncharacterized protein YndB with AHSA1/START domain